MEVTKYSYIWEEGLVDGQNVKLYHLTKWSKDRLDDLASKTDINSLTASINRLRQEVDFMRITLSPQLLSEAKNRILALLDSKVHHRYSYLYHIRPPKALDAKEAS